MRVEQQALTWLGFLYLSVEASVFFNVYCTVQEGHTVSSDIFQLKLDVIVNSIYMFCEGVHFPCSNFDPGVVYMPEPVARSISCEVYQGSALNFVHVEVGQYWGHWWAHGTAMHLSVETFTVLEVGGCQTEVQNGTNVDWGIVGAAGQSAVLWQAFVRHRAHMCP